MFASTVAKRDGRTEAFDAEKLLYTLKFILQQTKTKDNPISKKVVQQTITRLEHDFNDGTPISSDTVRQAVTAVLLENNLKHVADYYNQNKGKKLPMGSRKETYRGAPVRALNQGLRVTRRWTKMGESVFDQFTYEKRNSIIRDPDGKVIAEIKDVEVPTFWTQVATDILAQKYLRKAGVPERDSHGNFKLDEHGEPLLGMETSIKQVAHRMAGCSRDWGERYGYFYSKEDAQAYEDEMTYTIIRQLGAPNSPQWFNTGLAYAYGITGTPQGHYLVNPDTGILEKSQDTYTHPQPHACFIQSVSDDLVNEGGIFDLVTREARLFKYGSGTGSNFSSLRSEGERLSGGGRASGMMSFLRILDRAAGAIKSGGTTRRAAKMVVIDIDHPDVEEFIDWKMNEEQKVASLVAGSRLNHHYLLKIMKAAATEKTTDWNKSDRLKALVTRAVALGTPLNYIERVLRLVDQGYDIFNYPSLDTHFESEAYTTVSGQNSNNSVRLTNDFMQAVAQDKDWSLLRRTDGQIAKTVKAKKLWDKINFAAWSSADPGLQFHDTVNEWHTCPTDGQINASNPCSEYMFLDDTACNLASINLIHFLNEETGQFEIDKFRHAVRLWTITLEISVLMAQFPSKQIAWNSFLYRTLGLGYANLGTLLMTLGIPYDSPQALAYAGAITSIMGGESYATSAELAD